MSIAAHRDNNPNRMYLRSLAYFRPELPRIITSFLMVVAGTFLGLVPPLIQALLIDLFTPEAPKDTWVHALYSYIKPASTLHAILLLTALMLTLKMLKEVLQMYQTLLNIKIGYHGLMHVRVDLFNKLQQLSIGYHRSQPQGDAIYRLSWDTFGFQTLYNVIFGSAAHLLTLGLMLGMMFSFSWKLTVVSLAVIPFLLWAIKSYGAIMQDYSTQAKEADSKLTTAIQRSVAAISLVQAFNRQADEQLRFTSTVQSSISAWMNLHKREVFYWLILGTIFTISSTTLFGYGGYLVYKGELSVGLLTTFLAYIAGIYDPLNKLSASGSTFQSALAGAKRVFETIDQPTPISDTPNSRPLPPAPRTLELKNVSFTYAPQTSDESGKHQHPSTKSQTNSPPDSPPSPLVLNNISCTILPGQMVAFVGSSGVGKTTLLSLLPRFYDPTSGAITLDGTDIRQIKLADLRKHIALVLQENLVLPTSIAENIAYGRPGGDATVKEITHAAELAGALPFIQKLPNGFNTEVAEGGGNLSGGQRQRLGIARALLTNAPILVLDEPTSALDPHTEQLITQTLDSLKGKRTLILVSHRLSTVLHCDQIFVMDAGQIAEQGTHEELVAKRGLYYSMAKHQLQLT